MEVVDFSSQYGSETSISYTVSNIAGRSSIYPSYGDFTQTAVLRTYGQWWHQSPSAVVGFKHSPQSFISEDFIELRFPEKLYPKTIEIYETYNAGAIVRILAYCISSAAGDTSFRWVVLWSGEPQQVESRARIFKPRLTACQLPTDTIRLEFNQRHLEYYTELDAVCLEGSRCHSEDIHRSNDHVRITDSDSPMKLSHCDSHSHYYVHTGASVSVRECLSPMDILSRGLARLHAQDGLMAALDVSDNGYFDLLPDEVVQLIVSYLDLTSLCRLSAVSHLFYTHCYDPMQYVELNLQPYWPKVTDSTLNGLISRCRRTQRLNLSWCGPYDVLTSCCVSKFFSVCGMELTCLRMACCHFVDGSLLANVANHCPNLTELDIQSCRHVDSSHFIELSKLTKLQSLNLYRTVIDLHSLVAIVRSCHQLVHLNLGSSTAVNSYDEFALELAKHCPNLRTLNVWRARGLTDIGLGAIANRCHWLEELDAGWCSDLQSGSGCFVHLTQCCRHLKKLFLTANRTVCDTDLDAIANYSALIEQLDILGTREVSPSAVQRVLENCHKLRLFDLSFCAGVDAASIAAWKEQYPNVQIKRSFQTELVQ